MIGRFAHQARSLIDAIAPSYRAHLRVAPASLRPTQVESRQQSWRADDRRLHVDAFPSRPNRGERILRVHQRQPTRRSARLARRRALRRHRPALRATRQAIHPWQAQALKTLRVTSRCAASTTT